MADLYNSDLGQNTRKVQPSSLFGTRNLKFLQISVDYDLFYNNGGEYDAYLEPNSMYSQIIRAVQQVAELYVIGAPTYISQNNIVIAIASDTTQWQYSEEGNYDYNEIGIDETEASHSGGGVVTQRGWARRYVSSSDGTDSAVASVCDTLFYFFRDNTPIGNAFSVRVLEDTGFGLLPGTYLI